MHQHGAEKSEQMLKGYPSALWKAKSHCQRGSAPVKKGSNICGMICVSVKMQPQHIFCVSMRMNRYALHIFIYLFIYRFIYLFILYIIYN